MSEASGQRRRFRESLKRQAVERVLTGRLPISCVAEALGVHETVLHRWTSRFVEPGLGPARRPVTQPQDPSPAHFTAEKLATSDALRSYVQDRLASVMIHVVFDN